VNKNAVAHLQSGTSEKRVMCGNENFRHRTGFGPAQLCGNARQIAFWHDDKLCLRATGNDSENAITNFPSADRIADCLHFTGEFQTRNVLRITRRRGIAAAPLQNIGVVQSRRVHTDADAISYRRRWRFDLHHTDSANPTMRCDNDCTHQSGYSSLA
jgi:hypothetical protein